MISVTELRTWLDTLADDATVGVDDGGLILLAEAVDGTQAYLEVGGMDEEEAES